MSTYNESRIYKIYCKLSGIDEYYVGSTANFISRCVLHKSDCNNIKSPRYNYKLYNYIRNNGGWENFTVEVLEKVSCDSRTELNIKEEYWQNLLQPTLNINKAHITDEELKEYNNKRFKEYYKNNKIKINKNKRAIIHCDKCDKTYKRSDKAKHQKTKYCKNYIFTTDDTTSESIIESDTDVE